MKIKLEPLQQSSYAPYGDVLSTKRNDITPTRANLNTAKRFDRLTLFENIRENAKANVCIFEAEPQIKSDDATFEIGILERHPYSTQVFVPTFPADYVAVVALGGDEPDLSTLKAFEATSPEGISYKPGVWHHPLMVMNQSAIFVSFVNEDGSNDDCETYSLGRSVFVHR